MNNLLLAACLTASLATASATTRKKPVEDYPKSIQVRATTLTQALAHHIHLNEAQYVRVKRLHLKYLNERLELERSLAGESAAERDTQLAAAQLRYEQKLSDMLRPEQRVAYQQLRANFTAHRL
jgi:DNA polymerase III epsilon subunit-like protein